MFDQILGLPLHPLVVHATVVIVPAAALTVLLTAGSRRFRHWAGWLPLLLSVIAVGLVPVSTSSGEALEHRLPHSDLIERHAHLADGLLLPAIVMLAGAAGLCWVWVKERAQVVAGPPRIVLVAVIVLAVVGVAATTVQVARIGHSGAEAAWSDVGQASPPAPAG